MTQCRVARCYDRPWLPSGVSPRPLESHYKRCSEEA